MSTNPLNNISQVYLEQIASPQLDERVRPGNVEKPLDKAAFKKRRRSLAGKEKSAEARSRGHVGKEWYNSGRTYSPDEAKRGRAKMADHERSTRKRSAIDPEAEDDNYSADKTKNPKKLRKQKAMGEFAKEEFEFWVNELVEEGYDLSDYTWEEMLDIYLDEAEGSYGATPKAYSSASKAKMTAKRKPFLKAMKSRTNPAGTSMPNTARKGMTADDRERARAGAAYGVGTRQDHDYPSEGPGGVTKNPKKLRKQKAMGELGESAVPGKPAERLGAVTAIPKSEQEAARERILAKTKAKREKMGEERNDEPGEGTRQKYGDMRGLDRSGAPTSFGGKWQSKERKEAGAAALARLNKEEIEIDEAGEKDPFGRPGGKYGGVKKGGGYDKGYQAMQKKLKELDKVKTEALDPVGKEDSDVDNDGKKGTNADKYLLKRRKAIGKAISTQEAKEVKRWWDDDGDGKGYEEGEVSGKFKRKKREVKEGFSNWRQDLIEIADVIEKEENKEKITEKKIKNKIKINPNMGEAVENLGGTLLEMLEIDEFDFILESTYDELLGEGYDEDDIEEALEFALTEANVTFGHDTSTGQKKKGNLLKDVGRLARQKLSSKVRGAKKAAKQAVATGARKVAKRALGVAREVEGGDKKPHTAERKPSTYRGAGAGQKERVSSGSYTPPIKKKVEKPADPWKGSSTVPQKPKPKPKAEKPTDPWEGSATTPLKAKATTKKATASTPKPKTATKKAAAPKAKAATTPKTKRKSKLDDLLASVRSESVLIDEKTLTAAETKEKERIVKSMKDKASDFEKRYPGRGKEVMYATATKMAKRMAEQALELNPKTEDKPTNKDNKKVDQQQDRMRQQEVQILQRKLQALRSAPKGTDPSITA